MPVKWTPETDQILLIKILETSDVSPKTSEIAARWPTSLERPTPRAISERIFKIRALAKASGTSNQSSASTASSTPTTPRKNVANGSIKKATQKNTNNAKAKAAGKRKRGARASDDDEADDDAEPNGFKSDNEDNGSDAMDEETPRKKSKANTTAKDKIADKDFAKVKREEMENGSFTDNNNGYGNPFGGDGSVEMADYA